MTLDCSFIPWFLYPTVFLTLPGFYIFELINLAVMRKFFTVLLLLFSISEINAQQKVIQLYNGAAPGSENWNWDAKELTNEQWHLKIVYNVSHPTLTVFLPDSSIATGAAVIVCPGGGFQFLSIESEGYQVAHWLNNKGIAAFVLNYRLMHS